MSAKARSRLATSKPNPWIRYLTHLPTLAAALICWALVSWVVLDVPPLTVQNFPLPKTYGPFLLATFLALFFTSSYLLLNTRRGLIIALAMQMLLFLKLQQVDLTIWVVISISLWWLGVLLLSELTLLVWGRK